MEVTIGLIKKCLAELRKNQLKYSVYDRYYRGDHDILRNYAMNESRSNMKIVVNYFKKFITDEIAYAIGNPISYISTLGDLDVLNLIDLNFSYWSKVHDQELIKQANIFGESYEVQYISSDGEFKATVLNPLQMFVLESGDAEKEVILALHLYSSNIFDKTEKLDVYVDNRILHYDIVKNELIKTSEDTHIFAKPPVVVCGANTERKSMLDDIKTEIDSFNTILSDAINEHSDFRMAMLKIIGAKMEEDDIKNMKKLGILQVPAGGNVDYIIKNINDTYTQNLLNTVEEKIYKLASHIDTNQKLQSNLSGTALRSRMIALENKCVLMQSMLELAIKKRLKNFFNFIKIKTGKDYDYRTIKLKLTMNIPSDLNLLADTTSKLRGLVSDETLLSILPFIENPAIELEKRRKEQEAEILDLDKLVGGEDE